YCLCSRYCRCPVFWWRIGGAPSGLMTWQFKEGPNKRCTVDECKREFIAQFGFPSPQFITCKTFNWGRVVLVAAAVVVVAGAAILAGPAVGAAAGRAAAAVVRVVARIPPPIQGGAAGAAAGAYR